MFSNCLRGARFAGAALVFASLLPVSASAWWGSSSYKTVCVQGWHAGNTVAAHLPGKWADYLLSKGYAVETGEYYWDADDDGYGRADAPARLCPTRWRAENNLDCDDENAEVYPGNGCGEEAACPCFTGEQIDVAYQAFVAAQWDETSLQCEDWTYVGDGFSYDWATLTWAGSVVSDGVTTSTSSLYYSVDYVDGDEGTSCTRSAQTASLDDATGTYVGYDEDFYEQALTAEEHAACVAVILDYAAAAAITCDVTTYP